MSNNYPDDCQGNNPNFPWNEQEEPECKVCNSSMTCEDGDLVCDNEDCTYVEYAPDEDSYGDDY